MPEQQRVGWRSYISPLSSLLTSIYGVWNAETTTTTLATGAYGAWNAEGTVTATQLTTSASNAWNAEGTGTLLDASIYSYWSGENVTTDLINGNNGTLMSGATFSTGKIGNAFSFNGSNSYLKLPNNSLNFTGDFSISCWVNVSGIDGWPKYIYAFGNLQNSGSNYFGYRLFMYGNGYAFDICNGTPTISGYAAPGAQGLFYNSASDASAQIAPVAGGAWKHVVITRKAGTGTKMYINGVLKTSNTSTVDPVYTTTHTPSIGAQIMNSGNSFGGPVSSIDLTSTWTKELSADEVLSLYNFGNATEYPYSTKTLPSAKDSIGAKNGTLMNGCKYTAGKIGMSAFTFDGVNDYVALPDNSLNSLVGDFTVSGWVYAPANTSSSYCVLLSNVSDDFTTGKGWSVFTYGNNIYFDVYYSGAYQSPNSAYVRLQVNSKLTNNAWNHIVVTRKNSTGSKIYVNGSLVGSDTSTLNPATPTLTVTPTIGVLSSVSFGNALSSYAPNGTKIDAVSTWSRELTSDEISALYNGGTGQQYPFSTITVGTPTDSVSTNNGTIVGGVTYTQGVVGNAFQFDGSTGYVSLPNDSFKPTGPFSITTWVKSSAIGAVRGILASSVSISFTSGFRLYIGTNGKIYLEYNSSWFVGTTTLLANTWYNVTVTYDGTTYKIFLNGSLESSQAGSALTWQAGTTGFSIGKYANSSYYFNGAIDGTTVWTKALTDDEITQLYNLGGGIQYPFTTQTIKTPYAVYNGENLNDSVGTNNLTVGAGTVTYTTGKVGNAFTLTAGQLNFPTNSMRFSGSFSYGMWIKYTGSVPQYNQIFTATGNQSKFGYSMYNYSGSLYTRFGDGTTVNNDMRVVLNPSFSFVADTWYHIAVVFNAGSSAQVYANGQLLRSVNHTMAAVTYDSTRPNPIFGNNPGTGAYGTMTGQVDGLTFWNSALTAPEVFTLFNEGNGMEYPYSSTLPAKLPSYGDVIGTNHGTSPATSAPTFTTGKFGKAYNFDGVNDHILLPSTALKFTGDFSVSLWVYIPISNSSPQALISCRRIPSISTGWEMRVGSNTIYFGFGAANGFKSTSYSNNSNIGSWKHVVATRKNGTGGKLYIDGILQGTISAVEPISYDSVDTPSIGAMKYAPNTTWYVQNGTKMDAISTWTKELTATEITDLYNSGTGKQYPNY